MLVEKARIRVISRGDLWEITRRELARRLLLVQAMMAREELNGVAQPAVARGPGTLVAARGRRSRLSSARMLRSARTTGSPRARRVDPVLHVRFRMRTLIGRGGCAEVHSARDAVTGERVALKMLLPNASGPAADDAAARMRREADLLSRLAALSHPCLPRLHARSAVDDCDPWLALEFVEGATLADRIAQGPITMERSISWVRDLADALDACHQIGVVHRDLKPGNIILGSHIKLIDWGIAHDVQCDGRVTEIGMVAGTPRYMSPEQAQDHVTGAPTDVYSLGITAYELLTGDAPFTGNSSVSIALRHVLEAPAPLDLGKTAGAELVESLVMSMLAKNPAHRPTMAQVREQCDVALAAMRDAK